MREGQDTLPAPPIRHAALNHALQSTLHWCSIKVSVPNSAKTLVMKSSITPVKLGLARCACSKTEWGSISTRWTIVLARSWAIVTISQVEAHADSPSRSQHCCFWHVRNIANSRRMWIIALVHCVALLAHVKNILVSK